MGDYVEARRELGITGDMERRVLRWLAERLPGWVQPDHLTALGLLSLLAGGVAYALTPRDLRWLHGVNLSLLLNWFGDSLDGTLARVRNSSRPRYGFYVDHLVDGFGAAALLVGLSLSGLAHPGVPVALLVAYLLLNVEIALAAHVTGVFRIARGPLGGTELRILLGLANLTAFFWPRVRVLGAELGIFDLIAAPASVTVLALVVGAAWTTARRLDALERFAQLDAPALFRRRWLAQKKGVPERVEAQVEKQEGQQAPAERAPVAARQHESGRARAGPAQDASDDTRVFGPDRVPQVQGAIRGGDRPHAQIGASQEQRGVGDAAHAGLSRWRIRTTPALPSTSSS